MALVDALKLPAWLTPDPATRLERQAARERQALENRRKQFKKLLQDEARYYERVMVTSLSRLGYYHHSEKRDVVETVAFRAVFSTPEAHYFRVETPILPTNTRMADLRADETLENLSGACERDVYAHYESARRGMWYILEREGGIRGIPSNFGYDEAYALLSERDAPLTFVVGVGVNGRVIKTNLAKAPHFLIGGSTSMGKSVCINNLITTIARRNTPERVQFYLVDLKGGMEMVYYEKMPHLAAPIVTTPEGALDVLDELLALSETRQNIMRGKAKSIQGWNRSRKREQMPYVVLVIDELAMLMLNPSRVDRRTVSVLATEKLAKLAAISRASGIHCVVATQQPSVNVVKGIIKANFPARIAFGCAQISQSMTILDNGMAARLVNAPGRLVFHRGSEYTELHGPYISEDMTAEIVRGLATGGPVKTWPVTPAELIRHAVDNFEVRKFDGEERWPLPTSTLFEVFKEKISIRLLDELLDKMVHDIEVECDGLPYHIYPGDNVRVPRTAAISLQSTVNAETAEGQAIVPKFFVEEDEHDTDSNSQDDEGGGLEPGQDADGDGL